MKIPFILVFLLFAILAQSQSKKDSISVKKNLSSITITATKSPKALDKLPMPTTVVSGKEIMQSGATTLDEVLEEQTGIITTTNYVGNQGVQLQGLDAAYTLILIDGMPVIGRSSGTLDLKRISVNDVKKVEIVRGASSSLYGSDAIGGVVNIITNKKKAVGLNGWISQKISSYNTFESTAKISYKTSTFSISNAFNYLQSDGYDLIENNGLKTVSPYKNYNYNAKANYSLSDKVFFQGNFSVFKQSQQSERTKNQNNLFGENKQKDVRVYAIAKHYLTPQITQEFDCFFTNYKTKEVLNYENGDSYSSSFFNQKLLKPEYQLSYTKNENNIIFGIGAEREGLERTDFSESPKTTSYFSFLQTDYTFYNTLNIIAGSRYDKYTLYDSEFSNKAAISLQLSEKFTFKSSIGSGYKTPDFRQLYFDFTNSINGYSVLGSTVVNDKIQQFQSEGILGDLLIPLEEIGSILQAENSLNINVGGFWEIVPQLNFDMNIFQNNIYNLIEPKLVAHKTNGSSIFTYFNVAQVRTRGLECNLKFSSNKKLKLNVGYQLLFADDMDAIQKIENGDVYALSATTGSFRLNKSDYFGLFNRSRHTFNAKLYYTFLQDYTFNLRTNYRSKFAMFDSNGNDLLDKYDQFIPAYFLWNTGVSKTYKNTTIIAGINNLMNYTNPTNLSHISGRNYFINLNIQLNKKQEK